MDYLAHTICVKNYVKTNKSKDLVFIYKRDIESALVEYSKTSQNLNIVFINYNDDAQCQHKIALTKI